VPDDRGAPFLFQLASQEHVQVRHLRASVPTLEDVFAKAVGESDTSVGSRTLGLGVD
jgi:hypothetical protein